VHRPESVLYLGGRALSKKLGQLLAESKPHPFVVVRPDLRRFDPDHVVSDRIQSDVQALARTLPGPPPPQSDWLRSWRQADMAVRGMLRERLDSRDELTEPQVARLVTRHLSADSGLVLAASMPVRDGDLFAAPDGPRVPVAMNRGASGIDGTVATAAGYARGLGGPTTLLIGDLALLHDLNSLALLRQPGQPQVVIVAVNNDGGGIFHFLPIADHERFEGLFGTPHGLGFRHAAEMFGLRYAAPTSAADFERAFREVRGSGESAILEVRTDREANRVLHAELREAAVSAVDDALDG
jgi:2-succinyl-5-enolpyruvyl-6-hydroxy-3-cyclohexene-1-carboxylate synthase